MARNEDTTIFRTLQLTDAFSEFTVDDDQFGPALAPNIGPGITRVVQDSADKRLRGLLPDEAHGLALTLVHRQFQVAVLEPQTSLADTPGLAKDPKHLTNGLLHALIGVFDDLSRGIADVAGRQQTNQFTTPRFGLCTLLHALMKHFEFSDTHGALYAQYQLVIQRTDVIDLLGVGDQRAKQLAQFK